MLQPPFLLKYKNEKEEYYILNFVNRFYNSIYYGIHL